MLDASRAVSVVSDLLSEDLRDANIAAVRSEYTEIASKHARGSGRERQARHIDRGAGEPASR